MKLATGVSVANDQKIEALSVYNDGIDDTASYAMAYPTARRPPTWSGSPT